MDYAKIAFPKLQMTNKMICGFAQLPNVTLIGMIAHGHGDENYA
jgi:hypothetical protein